MDSDFFQIHTNGKNVSLNDLQESALAQNFEQIETLAMIFDFFDTDHSYSLESSELYYFNKLLNEKMDSNLKILDKDAIEKILDEKNQNGISLSELGISPQAFFNFYNVLKGVFGREPNELTHDMVMTLQILNGVASQADDGFYNHVKNTGVVSDAVNLWHEIFNSKITRSAAREAIEKTKNDIKLLIEANKTGNFESKFVELRGVPCDYTLIKDCKQKSEEYIRVKTLYDMIAYIKGNLEDSTTLRRNYSYTDTGDAIIEAMRLCGMDDNYKMNQCLKNIEIKLKQNHSESYSLVQSLSVQRDNNGRGVIYRTTPAGTREPVRPEELKLIAAELSRMLDESFLNAVGINYDKNSSAKELSTLVEQTVETKKTSYEESFEKAFGSKDANLLVEQYIEKEQQGLANLQMGTMILSMAIMFVPGGQIPASAGWLVKGVTVAKMAATAGMVLHPMDLLEKLTSDGLSSEEFQEWLLGCGESAMYMALGMGVGKVSEGFANMYKTKALIKALNKKGKSIEEIRNMIKGNPMGFPKEVLEGMEKIDILATALHISSETALDLISSGALTYALHGESLTTFDVVQSLASALAGGTLQKQFASMPYQDKFNHLKNALADFDLTDDDIKRLIKKMDDVSKGEMRTTRRAERRAKQIGAIDKEHIDAYRKRIKQANRPGPLEQLYKLLIAFPDFEEKLDLLESCCNKLVKLKLGNPDRYTGWAFCRAKTANDIIARMNIANYILDNYTKYDIGLGSFEHLLLYVYENNADFALDLLKNSENTLHSLERIENIVGKLEDLEPEDSEAFREIYEYMKTVSGNEYSLDDLIILRLTDRYNIDYAKDLIDYLHNLNLRDRSYIHSNLFFNFNPGADIDLATHLENMKAKHEILKQLKNSDSALRIVSVTDAKNFELIQELIKHYTPEELKLHINNGHIDDWDKFLHCHSKEDADVKIEMFKALKDTPDFDIYNLSALNKVNYEFAKVLFNDPDLKNHASWLLDRSVYHTEHDIEAKVEAYHFMKNLPEFPKELMERILEYTREESLPLLKDLCLDKNFPADKIHYIIERVRDYNLEFAKDLCKNPEFPKDEIVDILYNTTDDNIELAKDLCKNPEFPIDEIAGILSNTRHNNIELAKRMCNDNKFPKEEINGILNVTKYSDSRMIEIAEDLCFNMDYPIETIASSLSYIERLNNYDCTNIVSLNLSSKINVLSDITNMPPVILGLYQKYFPELNQKINLLKTMLGEKKDVVLIPPERQRLFVQNILANNNPAAENVLKNFDFAQYGKQGLPLEYTREEFSINIENIIKNLPETEQELILQHFGLEKGAAGYDGLPTNKDFPDEKTLNPETREAALFVKAEIEKFTVNNRIKTGDDMVDEVLNGLIQGFPEFTSIVGKEQHGTHAYSVDIHTLKVLQSAMNNPLYEKLSDKDKTILKFAALCHDFGKKGGVVDTGHASLSAEYIISILDKFQFPQSMKDRMIDIVDNHHWFEAYNTDEISAEDVAIRCRRPEDFTIYEILAKADFENVNKDFHLTRSGVSNQAEFDQFMQVRMRDIENALTTIYSKSNLIFDTQFMKNGEKFPRQTVTLDGEQIELRVLNLNDLEDSANLEQYGFAPGVTKDNARFTVHMTEPDDMYLGTVLFLTKNALNHSTWSTSLIKASNTSTYYNQRFGFILDVDQTNISEAYYKNLGSGYQKNLKNFQNILFYNDGKSRTYVKNNLITALSKRGIKLNDEEYAELTKILATKKYLTQINKDIQIGKKVIKAKYLVECLEESRDTLFLGGNDHSEIVSLNPRVKGLIAKVDRLEDCPSDFLRFAKTHNLPIILMRERRQ